MKNLLIVLSLIFTLSSCVDLGFYEPQPLSGKIVKSLPNNYKGKYINKKDTIIIGEQVVISGKDSTSLIPSENMILKKWKDYYFVNSKENNQDYWTVVVVRLKKNKLDVYMPEIGSDDGEKLSKNYTIEEIKNKDGKIQAFIINPPPSNWSKFLKRNIYSKNTLRKSY